MRLLVSLAEGKPLPADFSFWGFSPGRQSNFGKYLTPEVLDLTASIGDEDLREQGTKATDASSVACLFLVGLYPIAAF